MATIDFSSWDASKAWAAGAKSDDPAAFYNGICAGKKAGDPKTQEAHALPYRYSPSSAPNANGVRNALSRLPQTKGLTNASAAKSKLEGLLKKVQAAENNRSLPEMDARAFRSANVDDAPGGTWRVQNFPGELRGKFKTLNGRKVYEVEGYSTVYDRGYKMWDRAGEYMEIMAKQAFDYSLAASPDVAFLVNHKGITMARTRSRSGNPTLTLRNDSTGMGIHGILNADRQDVRDLASAIDDELVDEMSLAFMIDEHAWNEEFTEFTITRADINRGDVSAVNYGANPFTTIQARASQWLDELEMMPDVVVREAITIATRRDSSEALFAPAAETLSEASRERYMRAADFNAEAAARASAHVEDDDLAESPQETRSPENNPDIPRTMTIVEARKMLHGASVDDYKRQLRTDNN